ncbi:hypothetical protein [Anditalea andensis]|nr:hypothetical protein [Anditalea andensis]
MKNSLVILGTILLMGFSCDRKDIYPDKAGCYDTNKTIKTASNAKGMIQMMEKDAEIIWYILSMEGIIGDDRPTFDARDVVIPCNLQDQYKEIGLNVVFSGNLEDTGQDFGDFPHIYYTKLSKINLIID